MTTLKKAFLVAGLWIFIMSFGVSGFMWIDDMTFGDAFYMTVITITTIGYFEVQPLSPNGRIFNVILIFLGVGIIYSTVGGVWLIMLEGRLQAIMGRRRLEKELKGLKDHYIVCGFGRVGRIICGEIRKEGHPLVVIEKDPAAIQRIEEMKVLFVEADATEEKVLRKAGIEHARGLVTCLVSDAENVYVCLTAKEIRPDLFILSRASSPDASKRLLRAGASRVVSPYYMGARKMAQELLRPVITNFVEIMFGEKTMELQFEEVEVGPASQLHQVMLRDSGIRQELDLIIVAIKKPSGEMLYNPRFDAFIEKGDTLVALGRKDNLLKLAERLGSARHSG
ncbi:MAG: potassium channel protein [Deltaproteobacteria bacterium]|nr:potassium channel protein [Deltaproteobacteria bacterium]